MVNPACLAEITKAAGRALTDQELTDLEGELKKRIRQRRQVNRGESLDEAVLGAADDYAKQMAEAAIIEKRNAAINLRRKLEAIDKVRSTFSANPALGLESLLVGVNNAAKGARLSAATEQSMLTSYYLGGFVADVEKQGLWKAFVSGAMDREIAQALWAVNRELPQRAAVPKEAMEIAKVVAKWQEIARQDANKAGAWIGKVDGYITRQSHDAFKIRSAGFEAWKADILPRLDIGRTLDGDTDIDKFLAGVYQGLASGVHLKAPTGEPSGFKGPRNIAKKASQERVLHFKDADAWFDYNLKYGVGSLRESVIRSLETSGQNTGLMRVLGTNPGANFQQIVDTLTRDIKDPEKQANFVQETRGKLANQMKAIDGTMRTPIYNRLARGSAFVRAWENLAKLGLALASQFSDLPNFASEIRYQGGGGYLSGIAEALGGMLRGRGSAERRELGGAIGVFSDSMKESATARFSAGDDGLPGLMTTAQRLFFKLNGMQWWNDSLKRAAFESMSHLLAMRAGQDWNGLGDDMRRVLGLFGIDDKSWNVIREAQLKDIEGRSYLVPDEIENLPDQLFADMLNSQGVKVTARRVADAKRELADKVRSYIVDRAGFAALEPDARVHATLLRGTQAGTVEGEFARFVMQFKSFTGAFTMKSMGREVYGRGADQNAGLRRALLNGNGEILGLAQLILWTTAFGYISRTVKDLLKGREPRDPLDPKTWMAALVQGGGMGLYGDILFGETRKRYGGDIWGNLLGPAAGLVSDLGDLWGRAKEGDDTAAAAFKATISHTPFVNIFYFKMALDYLFFHQIAEAFNPGSLKRHERRVEQETGQRFLVRPSQNYSDWMGLR